MNKNNLLLACLSLVCLLAISSAPAPSRLTSAPSMLTSAPSRGRQRLAAGDAGNPIFPGWYADPETAVYDNTYWVYPTYSAPYKDQVFFDAFSSPDLVHWDKHPRILDTTAIRWAKKAMWAPAIAKKDGKYYFFFGANDIQNDSSTGGIGIAVADQPGGPYHDYLGRPLIDKFYNGAQPIDQAVFQDHDGSWYLIYGGWRHCNIARLKPDFTGLLPFEDGSVFKEITPDKYVEGPYMIEHSGKYYFMWSEGGWGGPDYSVAYAIANKPTGPFKRIGKILQQDMAVATGAGHHSVLHIPGTDDYYIVYHRRPLGETDANHRVVCIDKMEFDPDGLIRPVKITREGVAPRLPASAQKTEKFYDYQWKATDGPHARFYSIVERTDSGYHRLDYYVHDMTLQMEGWFEDSTCKIRSGKFTYLYPGKLLESTGRYLHNRKEGLWLVYHPNGMMADSTVYGNGLPIGTSMAWHSNGIPSDSCVYNSDGSGVKVGWFDNGNPSYAGRLAPDYKHYGKWQFFHKNGQTSAFELYNNGNLVNKQYFDEAGQPVLDTTNKDRGANFVGGSKAWLKYLGNHLYFPTDYTITNSDEAALVITATIDEDGKIKDAFVSIPFYPPFEKIALGALHGSPKWQPAMNHNRRVSTVVHQPVIFSQAQKLDDSP